MSSVPNINSLKGNLKIFKKLYVQIAVLYFVVFLFIFREIIWFLPDLLHGDMVINGDELVPFFDPHSQFIDQIKGEFNELTHGLEFRVRYSLFTSWMRYYKILPFALLFGPMIAAYISFVGISIFLQNLICKLQKTYIIRAAALVTLMFYLILLYAKVTHFYTLVLGFAVFLIASLLFIYGLVLEKTHCFDESHQSSF